MRSPNLQVVTKDVEHLHLDRPVLIDVVLGRNHGQVPVNRFALPHLDRASVRELTPIDPDLWQHHMSDSSELGCGLAICQEHHVVGSKHCAFVTDLEVPAGVVLLDERWWLDRVNVFLGSSVSIKAWVANTSDLVAAHVQDALHLAGSAAA